MFHLILFDKYAAEWNKKGFLALYIYIYICICTYCYIRVLPASTVGFLGHPKLRGNFFQPQEKIPFQPEVRRIQVIIPKTHYFFSGVLKLLARYVYIQNNL